MELFGIALGVIGIVYAMIQRHEALKADNQRQEAEAAMPDRVAQAVVTVLKAAQKAASPDADESTEFHAGTPPLSIASAMNSIEQTDLDGDGRQELLIQYPAGAHGSALQVFGFRDGVFQEVDSLATGTPAGFRVADFDNDGKLEVEGYETDFSTDEPYVSAPRLRILWRLNGSKFEEVARQPKRPFSH